MTVYLDLGPLFFSLHSDKLFEVLYRRTDKLQSTISMLCSRFVANVRNSDLSNDENIEYEEYSDDEFDLHSDKFKLGTTVVENGSLNFKMKVYDKGAHKINAALKNIGLVVCNSNSKQYNMEPLQIYYYKNNIASYLPNGNHYSPKSDNSLDSPGKNYYEESDYKSVFLKLSSEKEFEINVDENRNYNQNRPITPKSTGYIRTEKKSSHRPSNQKRFSNKYWTMRHMLFSKFEHGILLDDESFYSVCPEILSYHIAKRCRNDIALDPFCGAGGNIIQLAFTSKLVIAIDIDPYKIKLAQNNAKIYGVADKIEFIVGNFFEIFSMLRADVICMSPPWGGPKYLFDNSFSIASMCKNYKFGGFTIFDIVKNIAPNIAFHMPKTTNIFECLWLARFFGKVEVQQNIINEKLNSITAFYGDFIDLTNNDY
ncbi:trimethylguanosine synthase-like [Melanaphis sacchari]|uniref:Trimethylguanosine synthase n=1 Tax=Melanaphis sacchari TaxID=742174 RepID=A0A2H8TQE8_9HEMI|nr:trimethylguanosine synthase-like [Melanaphis sacchari]